MAIHGGNTEEIARKYKLNSKDIIDFSANINPVGLNENVKTAMINAIDKVVKYPDITYFDLKNSIGEFEKIDISNITLGNGAAEVIFNIVRALKPKKALLPAPTFSEYEEAIISVNGEIQYYKLKEYNDFKLDYEFIDKIKDDIDIIFICNPNNPTGELVSIELLEKILKRCREKDVMLVMDECFNDFIEEPERYTMKNYLKENKNLFI